MAGWVKAQESAGLAGRYRVTLDEGVADWVSRTGQVHPGRVHLAVSA